jgi:histidyl-tRNA synthetase
MTNANYNNSPDLVLMGVSEEFNLFLLPIMSKLINSGIKTETLYIGNISKKFKRADKINASFAIIIGDNEVAKNTVQLKNLKSGSQDEIQLDEAIKNIKKLLNLNLE